MEKRLKYLLGFLIVGVGLLTNQSFGNLFLEGVTLPLLDDFSSSSSYLYNFNLDQGRIGSPDNSWSYLGYYQKYDDVLNNTYAYCENYYYNSCPINSFNNSSFGVSLYSGWNLDYLSNSYSSNISGSASKIKISFGVGGNFGKLFVYTNNVLNDDGVLSPHYSLGGGFFTNNEFKTYQASDNVGSNFVRVFYNQNVNLSSPLDGFNLIISSGSNMGSGFIAWQSFSNQSILYQTQYNSSQKYIVDYGSQYTKGVHFGGYGMGYSSVINTLGSSFIKRQNLSFFNVGSRCLNSLMNLGSTSFDNLISNNCMNLGILILKGDSYVSHNNNGSVLLLSKNPSNQSQILYEQFDCAQDDLYTILSGDSCISISHGYIKHNDSDIILPFSGFNDEYTIGDGNGFIDLLFNDGIYGYVTMSNNQYCLNSTNNEYCFSLVSTPNLSSLHELFLQGSIGGIPTSSGQLQNVFFQNCMTLPGFYSLNKLACDSIINSYQQPTEIPGMTGYYTSYGVNDSGNVVVRVTYQEDFENTGFAFIDDGNGGYYACVDPHGCEGVEFNNTGSDILSSGTDSLKSYFKSWFESGYFFSCPFPYGYGSMEVVNVGFTKIFYGSLGRDLLYPLYCMGAGFRAGKNIHFFNGFSNALDGRLLNNNDYSSLYNLFDLILSIGILFIIIKIYHLLN